MGGRRKENKKIDVPVKLDNESVRAQRGRHLGDRNGRNLRRANTDIGNQGLIEDQDDNILNKGMLMEDEEVDAMFNDVIKNVEDENKEEEEEIDLNKSSDNLIIDNEEEEDRKSNVAEFGDEIKESEKELDDIVGNLRERGLIKQAENASLAQNEIKQINQAMQPVKGWNFATVPKERRKPSKWKKFWNRATTVLGLVTKAVANIVSAPVAIYKYASSKIRLNNAKRQMQAAINMDTIPGRGGETFTRKANETAEEFLGDIRRVPAVWSFITAEEAEKTVGLEKKAKDPEVTIMIDQPKEGSAEHFHDKEIGHAMIGINYTRYSNVTGRNERYGIKYGFYPAGGMAAYGTAPMALRGALLPGELKDDRNHSFSVSRRYPANMEQVGRILKESETYAKGGYGYYKRNCTTFVRDMAVNIGGIAPAGDTIFKEAEVEYNSKNAFFKYLGQGAETYLNSAVRNDLTRFSKSNDLNYANYGNKRVTAEDIKRYDESMSKGLSNRIGFIPAEVGEKLRYETANQGKIGSYNYAGTLGEDVMDAKVNPQLLADQIKTEAGSLRSKIIEVVTNEKLSTAPADLRLFVDELKMGGPVYKEIDRVLNRMAAVKQLNNIQGDKTISEVLNGDEIKRARARIAEGIEEIGTVYDKYLGIDSRLNQPLMNMLSLYQLTLVHLDEQYEKYIKNNAINEKKEFSDAWKALNQDKMFIYNEKNTSFRISPSQFESYMQMNDMDAAKAVKMIYETNDLEAKKQANTLTKEEKKRYKELEKYQIASQEFAMSHRYMVEKNEYSAADIDYVMKLTEGEQNAVGVSGEGLTGSNTAGSIYRDLIVQSIFGGVIKKYSADYNGGQYKDDFEKIQSDKDNDHKCKKRWITDYIKNCVTDKSEQFRTLMTTLYNRTDNDKQQALGLFSEMMLGYFCRIKSDMDEMNPKDYVFLNIVGAIMDVIYEDLNEYIKSFMS